ncbi:MAG: hypothetical protein ACYC7A_02915 [Thermoanaerobaculia bacterium]
MRRASILVLLSALLVPAPLFSQIDGVWRGSMTVFEIDMGDPCGDVTWTSTFAFTGTATGDSFSGVMKVYDVYDFDTCSQHGVPVWLPVTGSVAETSLFGILHSDIPLRLTATVTGSSLAFHAFSSVATVDGTATRQPNPGGTFAGSWNGTYRETCAMGTGSGPLTMALFQNGPNVVGTITTMPAPPCEEGTSSVWFEGTAAGSTLTGTVFTNEGSESVQIIVSGNTLTLTALAGGFTATFARGGPGDQLAIDQFGASPSAIRSGGSTTLSWSTRNATTVSIDNGVGIQAAAGTITVSPASTTRYTLTATGDAGSLNATTTVAVVSVPTIVVTKLPPPMMQIDTSSGATTRFTIANTGGASSSITLTQDGTFFTQAPTSFTLAPGTSQTVSITATTQPAGAYRGTSFISGDGVPPGLSVSIGLLSAATPAGTVVAKPLSNRIDVTGEPGVARFTNSGTTRLVGIPAADVPWIVPNAGDVIAIEPGGTADVGFTVDRSRRPDATALSGSAAGVLTLAYLSGAPGKHAVAGNGEPVSSSAPVNVFDTVIAASSPNPMPALAEGEVALFLPAVGHVRGSVGLFLSDVSILNSSSSTVIDDLTLYYLKRGATVPLEATIPSFAPNQPVALADAVKNMFGGEAEVGTLIVRSRNATELSVNANVFNASNPLGNFGSAIPVFRSDRALEPGEKLYITGLRRAAGSHTNLYFQELSGFTGKIVTEFLDANGLTLGSRTDDVTTGYVLLQLLDASMMPFGTVSAVITNDPTSSGTVVSFATPVDEAGGDTWAITDWSLQGGYDPSVPVVIPVAGSVHGANQTFFRTDAAIMNTGPSRGTVALRFITNAGATFDKELVLEPRETRVLPDIAGSFFAVPGDSLGFIIITPESGTFAVTSRTYTTLAASSAEYGTGVPTLPLSSAMRLGETRRIAGIDDASLQTILAHRPATFRTNLGLLETGGASAKVRITLHFTYPAGTIAAVRTATREFDLAPYQYQQLNNIARRIIGESRDTEYGDLRNMQMDLTLISGEGRVMFYTSSTDNGSGDALLRVE